MSKDTKNPRYAAKIVLGTILAIVFIAGYYTGVYLND